MHAGKIDEQRIKDLDIDVRQFLGCLQEKLLSFLGREEGRLFPQRLVDHSDHDTVEHAGGPLDDVEMPVRDRVVRARADGLRWSTIAVRGWHRSLLPRSGSESLPACFRSAARPQPATRAAAD